MVDGVNVNQSLIEAGYTWQYRKYCKDSFCSDWLKLEKYARTSKLGLWTDKVPVPPWEWRKAKRGGKTSRKTASSYTASAGGYHGNVKSHVLHGPNCRHYNC